MKHGKPISKISNVAPVKNNITAEKLWWVIIQYIVPSVPAMGWSYRSGHAPGTLRRRKDVRSLCWHFDELLYSGLNNLPKGLTG
jgi:hypothetical protein